MNKFEEVSRNQSSSVKISKNQKRKHSGDQIKAETSPKRQFSSVLDELKSCCRKVINLEKMEKDKLYKIRHAEKVDSQHGVRILLDLENDQKLYLPERFNALSKNVLDDLSKQIYGVINRGKSGKSYDLDFEELTSDQQGTINEDIITSLNFDQYSLPTFYDNYNP